MSRDEVETLYRERLLERERERALRRARVALVSYARLATFVAGVALLWFVWEREPGSWPFLLVPLAVFGALLALHVRLHDALTELADQSHRTDGATPGSASDVRLIERPGPDLAIVYAVLANPPYRVLDAIERAAIRDKLLPADVLQAVSPLFAEFSTQQLAAWVERFFRLWCRNQWKRERYAPSFHVDDENLDPKTWCRFPILSGGFERELEALRRYVDAQ